MKYLLILFPLFLCACGRGVGSDGEIHYIEWPNGSTARWEWHYGAVRPEGHACVERDLSNLVKMSDLEFEQLVRSIPKSPNENLVREWRNKMRDVACKKPFPVPEFNHMPDLYPEEDE